jgi:ABC-type branched-subunit amino acid transport system ATPase component
MLTVQELRFNFPGRALLDGVSFELRTHSVNCLLGGNGSGKTTLFNLITGFLRPDAGSIMLGGKNLICQPPFRISRMGVARTFQDLRLIGKLSVDEPVAGISPEYCERIAERLASLRAAGKTILLIEHQPDFLERVGECFLLLESGRLHAFDILAALSAVPGAHGALNN